MIEVEINKKLYDIQNSIIILDNKIDHMNALMVLEIEKINILIEHLEAISLALSIPLRGKK
jgi:hypothetical protein